MGWLFFYKAKGVKSVDTIKDRCGAEWCAKHFVAASATREAVFIVGKFHEPESKEYVPDADGMIRALLVFKIKSVPNARDGYNFGYKDMSETMGPYGCPAPLSIIAQCSELQDPVGPPKRWSSLQSARDYRAASAAYAAQKALKRGLKPGSKVTLPEPIPFAGIPCQTFTVERCRVRGRKGISTVFRAENGMLCGLAARHLAGATIAA
ncbi:MAG TPA: hypothetical protein VM867_08450 [Xanthobacteraceae bacterium]|nr:hypothetical protein [Xanthobacteraceae bacterium]